jgi:signal transduction histidine kinase
VRQPIILIAAGDPAEAARRLEAAGLEASVAASPEEAATLARREVLLATGKAEAIAGLAGGLAHHLNNLLATALMSLELLAPGGPEETDIRAGLEDSLRQAVALLRQMLALASSAAGEPAPFQLRSLLTDAQRMLRTVLPPGVELVTDYPPDLPLLFGEPAVVHQLLLRLGLAAREAVGEEGRLTLAARLRPAAAGAEETAPCVQVEVTASRGAWRPPAEAEELIRSLGGSTESPREGSWRVSFPVASRIAP